jgi:hypothetical protein
MDNFKLKIIPNPNPSRYKKHDITKNSINAKIYLKKIKDDKIKKDKPMNTCIYALKRILNTFKQLLYRKKYKVINRYNYPKLK